MYVSYSEETQRLDEKPFTIFPYLPIPHTNNTRIHIHSGNVGCLDDARLRLILSENMAIEAK